MESKKVCPLKFTFGLPRGEQLCCQCDEENCAWWCEWAQSCAMVTIPAEISDRAHDIMQTIKN